MNTIIEVMPAFKRYCLYERGMKTKSYRHIRNIVFRLTAFAGYSNISLFTTDIIRAFLYDQKERFGWESPRTFRNNRQYLMTFFSWLCLTGKIKKNPVISIERPKVSQSLPRFLTKEQVHRINSTLVTLKWSSPLQALRNRAIVLTFLYSGIRLQELLDLRTDQVNLESGTLDIRKGKGDKDRIVPIHPSLTEVLKSYINKRSETLSPSIWFFTPLNSSHKLYPKDIYRIIEPIKQRSGISFSPHQLRHTFGRMAVESNFNLHKLQRVMGHSSITTTQIYMSTSTEGMKESFNRLDLF